MRSSGVWDKPIVVQVEGAKKFYPAEEYHQDFAKKNPNHPYIRRWDAPKVVALKAMYLRIPRDFPPADCAPLVAVPVIPVRTRAPISPALRVYHHEHSGDKLARIATC